MRINVVSPADDHSTPHASERPGSTTRCFGAIVVLHCDATWSGVHSLCSFVSFQRLIHRSSQIIAQPQAPLHDALLEILRVSGYPNLSVVSVVIPVRLDISGTTARTSCEHRPTTRTDETDAEPQRMAHERDARPTH